MTTVTNYNQLAIDFLESTNTTFSATYLRTGKYFTDDKDERDIYQIELKRGNRKYAFEFGQSIDNSGFYYTKGKIKIRLDRKYLAKDYFKGKALGLAGTIKMKDNDFMNNGKSDIIHYPVAPTAYDVLACLTKYDVGTFENFCSEFGYDTDSIKAEKTYNAVLNEWQNVCALFSDTEIEQLQEIN
jgi:hypothetical protein